MYMIISVIVILILLIGSIQCPGAGGGRGEEYRRKELENHDQAQDYRGRDQDYYDRRPDYRDRQRENTYRAGGNPNRSPSSGISTFFLVIIAIIIISICVCLICCALCFSRMREIFRRNKQPVDIAASPQLLSEQNPFQTGIWAFRYHQYDKWHGPYRLLLTFDHQLWKVNGKGADDVGSFICDGVYSPEHRRLDLTLRYDEDTGNPEENLDHTSTLQLHWDSTRNAFEGTWNVRTPTYTGKDKFEMEFKEHTEPLLKPDHIQPSLEINVA